ncbi:MAG: hypothetical protein U0168_05915 [Nannocystaceae bacterium]
MSHLRRYLEQTGALPADHLDAALRRQQIYGGSLDTVLLELDLIDAHTLGELLVQACGLPLAPFELIDEERDRPWHALPDDVIEIGWAVPLCDRAGTVWIGVHPDLPNERLGALYRMMPGVQAFVLPECGLEKIAAERTASVVPQRYAVLCVSYLSAMRRRPSVSDIGFPMLHDPGSVGSLVFAMGDSVPPPSVASPDTERTRAPTLPPESSEPEDEFERRPTIVFEPPVVAAQASDAAAPTSEPPPPPAGDALDHADATMPGRGRTLILSRGVAAPRMPPPPPLSSEAPAGATTSPIPPVGRAIAPPSRRCPSRARPRNAASRRRPSRPRRRSRPARARARCPRARGTHRGRGRRAQSQRRRRGPSRLRRGHRARALGQRRGRAAAGALHCARHDDRDRPRPRAAVPRHRRRRPHHGAGHRTRPCAHP